MGRTSASGLIKEKERGPRLRNLPQRRSATALRRAADGESTRTVVIALLVNLVIAIAKLIAGLASRSTGLLAEAAHSAADSVNEIFLAVGLHRDRAPPDATHPGGHGRERFLWAFMAAISSFLIGGGLSLVPAPGGGKESPPLSGRPSAWGVLSRSLPPPRGAWVQRPRAARAPAR